MNTLYAKVIITLEQHLLLGPLSGYELSTDLQALAPPAFTALSNGDSAAVLTSKDSNFLLQPLASITEETQSVLTNDTLESVLLARIETYLNDKKEGGASTLAQFNILALGIACLNTFIQANVTGPPLKTVPYFLSSYSVALLATLQQACTDLLVTDGEPFYGFSLHPVLLVVAKICFISARALLPDCTSV